MKSELRKEFLKSLSEKGVSSVAVSKTKPVQLILQLYQEGFRDFGENRVQELVEKHGHLPEDIRWHMIGNLQKNKVKYIAPFVYLIHSVTSLSLLKVINKEAAKNERTIRVLLQIKIAREETKSGLDQNEALSIIKQIANGDYPDIALQGFMGMATFTNDEIQLREEFNTLKTFTDKVFGEYPSAFSLEGRREPIISMGMSGDFEIAIDEGSNMVRVGSLLFGPRE